MSLLKPTFSQVLSNQAEPQIGLWACSGSLTVAEITAGSGADWILIDAEHSPNTLDSVLQQLQVMAAYPVTTMVRLPSGDAVLIKQYLDLGTQNLLIPMVDTADQARELVKAIHYPPRGTRGVGAALSRSARWDREAEYLSRAQDLVSLFIQIESTEAVQNISEILEVEGLGGIFIGPADLAASMGYLGESERAEVVEQVLEIIKLANSAGVKVGLNAFNPELAKQFIGAGADFILVGADVYSLARSTENLVKQFKHDAENQTSTSGY